jgi:ATP-binding cassette subfamily B protein
MKQYVYNIYELFRVPLKNAKLYSCLIIIQKVLDGLIPSAQVFVIANFLDTAIEIAQGNAVFLDAVIPITLLILTIAYTWLSNQINMFASSKLTYRLMETLRVDVTDKQSKLRYEYIENNDVLDLIKRVSKEPEVEFKEGFMNLLSIVSMAVRVIGIVIIIASNVWWCSVIILLLNIPLIYLSIKNGEVTYQADKDVSLSIRKYEYLEDVLVGRDCAAERSIFRYNNYVDDLWKQQYDISRKKQIRAFFVYFSKIKLFGILSALVSILMIGLLIYPVIYGIMSLGLFISIATNLLVIVGLCTQQLTYCLKELTRKKEYVKDFKEFYMLKEEDAESNPTNGMNQFETIEFKNVSFKYPNSDNYILNNISFTLKNGKHYSFVGENGSGKTTIVKLLTGLYDNYEGEILINGISLREYEQSQIRSMCSVVYQDFAKYSIDVSDNIAIGDIKSINSHTKDLKVKTVLEQMNLSEIIESLPKKEKTVLGKLEENDIELSVGLWQRIAIARALIKDAPLKILDEPTAALDPISECNIYKEYEELSRTNTTIFISHRLGSVSLADEILVFDKGTIVESGAHKELIQKHGTYANMYENQRSWYV